MKEYLPEITDTLRTLRYIKTTGEMPKSKAHQYSRLYYMGLIDMQTKKVGHSTVFGRVYLKKKAKRMLGSVSFD